MIDDEAFATEFDILAKRAIDKAAADYIATNAKKLAMFPELVEALDECMTRLWQSGHAIDSHMNTLPDRARALEAK